MWGNACWHLVTAKKNKIKWASQKLQYTNKFFPTHIYWRVTGNNDLAQVWGESNLRCSIFPGCQHLWARRRTETELTTKDGVTTHTGTKKPQREWKTSTGDNQTIFISLAYFSWNWNAMDAETLSKKRKRHCQVACRERWLAATLGGRRGRERRPLRRNINWNILREVKDIKIQEQVKR